MALVYGSDTAITVTNWSTGLASGEFALSSSVSNTSNLYNEVFVGGEIAADTVTGTIVAGDSYDIYILGQYSDTATDIGGAIDALFGWGNEEAEDTAFVMANLRQLVSVQVELTTPDTQQSYHWGPIGISQFFGGAVPKVWGLGLHVNTADATLGSGSSANYYGLTF